LAPSGDKLTEGFANYVLLGKVEKDDKYGENKSPKIPTFDILERSL